MSDGSLRWQYRIVDVGSIFTADRLAMTLSHFGRRGWELVHTYDKASNWLQGIEKGFLILKRPVAPGEEPEGPWAEVWSAEQVAIAYEPSVEA